MDQLIPTAWFEGLHEVVLLGLVAASMFALMTGADWLVDGSSGLATRLGIPKIIVGATIVSLGTTAPECAVSVMAAWDGKSGLALGNAVGSIIADTGLIFGAGCLLTRLPVNRFLLSRQGWVQFGSAALLAGLCYGLWWVEAADAKIPNWAGAFFLVLLAIYLVVSVSWSRQEAAAEGLTLADGGTGLEEPGKHDAADDHDEKQQAAIVLLAVLLVGAAIVIVSSHVLIETVTVIAVRLSVPQVVISATLVAFGTSLPELVVGMTAIRRGHPELLVGNVIGADVLNVLFVIGASAIAAPLPIVDQAARVPEVFLYVHLPTMLTILVLFRLFIARAVRKQHFERPMGIPLVLLYLGFVVISFLLGGDPGEAAP